MAISGTVPPVEKINHAQLKDMPDVTGIETSHDARYARLVHASRDYIIIADGAGHYLQVPKLTTAQRDALTAVNGMIIYNTTTSQMECYQAGSWSAFGATQLSDLSDVGSVLAR